MYNFKQRNSFSTKPGFTIVELLIVVVVIAILAAITIVSYNGITTRAENTKTISTVVTYSEALTAYAALNGYYPPAGSPSDGSGVACLGSETCNLVAGSRSPDYYCYQGTAFPLDYVAKNKYEPLDTALKTIVSSLPDASSQSLGCNGGTYRGIFYYRYLDAAPLVFYFLKGSQECKSIGALSEVSGKAPFNYGPTSGMTLCGGVLPEK
jgi:prepilin-type N-terminal cleavage/methylation domain-containing protein